MAGVECSEQLEISPWGLAGLDHQPHSIRHTYAKFSTKPDGCIMRPDFFFQLLNSHSRAFSSSDVDGTTNFFFCYRLKIDSNTKCFVAVFTAPYPSITLDNAIEGHRLRMTARRTYVLGDDYHGSIESR